MKRTIILTLLLCMAVTASAQFGRSGPERQPFARGAYGRGEFGERTLPKFPGLILDVDPSKGITKDGANNISSVADQSGQGNDGTQGTAGRQPLWVDSQLSGYPIIRFDKSNDANDDGIFFTGMTSTAQSYTMIFVHKPVRTTGTAFGEYFMDIETDRFFFYHLWSDIVDNTGWVDSATQRDIVAAAGAGVWQTATYQFTKDGDGEFFRNGVSQGTDAVGNINIGDIISLGSRYETIGGNFRTYGGDMGRVLIWEGVLTSVELTLVWDYLNNKYGL